MRKSKKTFISWLNKKNTQGIQPTESNSELITKVWQGSFFLSLLMGAEKYYTLIVLSVPFIIHVIIFSLLLIITIIYSVYHSFYLSLYFGVSLIILSLYSVYHDSPYNPLYLLNSLYQYCVHYTHCLTDCTHNNCSHSLYTSLNSVYPSLYYFLYSLHCCIPNSCYWFYSLS